MKKKNTHTWLFLYVKRILWICNTYTFYCIPWLYNHGIWLLIFALDKFQSATKIFFSCTYNLDHSARTLLWLMTSWQEDHKQSKPDSIASIFNNCWAKIWVNWSKFIFYFIFSSIVDFKLSYWLNFLTLGSKKKKNLFVLWSRVPSITNTRKIFCFTWIIPSNEPNSPCVQSYKNIKI